MRRALSLATFAAILASASPAGAVGWSVSIESPGAAASGVVVVRARAGGGVGQPTGAAYHVRSSGGWSQGSAVGMGGSGAVWSASWATAGLSNGTYQLEVRMWGDVPPYASGDPTSYASRTVSVAVENAPPSPAGLSAALVAGEHRLSWTPIPTAGRSDFNGYRVWRSRGPGCGPGLSGYTKVAATDGSSYRAPADPGAWCFVVTAERSGPVAGSVASGPSSPAVIDPAHGPGTGGTVPGSSPGETPARPPATGGESSSEAVSDASSSTGAPAPGPPPSPNLVEVAPDAVQPSPDPTMPVDVAAAIGAPPRAGPPAGPSPVRFGAAATVAAGMILVLLSLHLRVFLGRARFR